MAAIAYVDDRPELREALRNWRNPNLRCPACSTKMNWSGAIRFDRDKTAKVVCDNGKCPDRVRIVHGVPVLVAPVPEEVTIER